MRAFQLLDPSFARVSGNNARIGVSRPVFRARFRRKCARSSSSTPHSRAIPAKVRAPECRDLLLARVSGESARVPAPRPLIRARFRRKCARQKQSARNEPGTAFRSKAMPRMRDRFPPFQVLPAGHCLAKMRYAHPALPCEDNSQHPARRDDIIPIFPIFTYR